MNESMLAPARELSVKVKLTLATGAAIELGGDQVLSFSVEEGADSALLPGNVLSARLTIHLANDFGQWRYGGLLRGERPLVGATAQVFVVNGEAELPCGAFIIDSVSARERSGAMTLSGSDSIASELSLPFRDSLSYPATLRQIWMHLVSQTRYAWSGELPNGSVVIDARPEWGDVTLRRAAGWIAQAAGCFVRVNRSGHLQIVKCVSDAAQQLSPDEYFSLDDGFHEYGPVTGVQVAPVNGEGSFTVSDGVGETVSVEGNPLFTDGAKHLNALAEGMLAQLKGLTLSRAAFTWRGDPSVSVGSRIALTDTYGQTTICTVTRQTMRFENGFTAECGCETPDRDDGGIVRAITPEGGVNAGALVGTVNGGLLAAGSVTAQSIAARAITAEKLAAGSVSADHLAAGSVTADKLDANSVSAKTAEFVAAEIGKISAGEVGTNSLYAAFAHLIELAAGSIRAGEVNADRLAAALAKIVTLHAATGEFDFATIENLISGALVLNQGVAGSVRIDNLAVTSANLLCAVLGGLTLKGEDGGYYEITVGSDGEIRAVEATVTEGEIAAGQTSAGKQIVETSMNVAELDAQNLRAQSAVVGQIVVEALTAGKITAGEALIASATIPSLYTTAVKAIGGSMDLSANDTIRLLLGAQNEMGRWITFSDAEGMTIRKPAWTDESGVAHPESVWQTITDETGYHIRRTDLPGYVGSFARDRLTVDGIQIGNLTARKTSTGGLTVGSADSQ